MSSEGRTPENRLELEIWCEFADRVYEDPDDPFKPVLCSNFDEHEEVKEKVLEAYGVESLEDLTEYVGDPMKGEELAKTVGVAWKINGEFEVEIDGEAA